MAVYQQQSVEMHNAKYVVLPPWKGGEDDIVPSLAIPDVYVLDTSQKYPIGTKFVDGDKVFHYSYIYSDTSSAARSGLGLFNLSEMASVTTDAVEHAVGETEIVIADTTSTLNQWAGGTFMNYVAPYYTAHRVLSNTATASSLVTLTLERGLIVASTASLAGNELYANQYAKVGAGWVSADYSAPVVGVLVIAPTASRWAWLQTWGPCIVAGGDEVPGSQAGYHMAQFNFDGTLIWVGWASAASGQIYAGHLINDTGATYTAQHLIYLMLAS